MITRRSLLALAVVPVAGALLAPFASVADEMAKMKVYTQDGVAIRGADPVAYFAQNAFVQGDASHALEWGGATWHFASAENKATFMADPKTYAPQFGGYCAYAASKGALADGDPEAWTIHNGKLYLNFSKNVRTIWLEDRDANIALAEANWPTLSMQN
ncbi:MAG: YHS domain-containing (seleno)protein [Pacificibacter sp.]|uniref:YHS domain-containing (seleno)protein n=1 Tax=Pacificibacter sp. TaxID=1917866 RepID=UPI00321A04F6